MKPTAGQGASQITKQGQTAQSQHASDPQAKGKGMSDPRPLEIKGSTSEV